MGDAHGDWNNEESSPSGNMRYAFFGSLRAGPDIMVDFGQDPVYVNTKIACR